MKKGIIITLLLLAVLVGGLFWWQSQKQDVISVRTQKVAAKDLVRTVTGTGVIEPIVAQSITLTAQAVKEVLKQEGDTVKTGDILLRYDDEEIRNQIEQLRLQLEIAKINLATTKDGRYPTTRAKNRAIDISEMQVETAELQLQAAEASLADTEVKADIDGVIVQMPTWPVAVPTEPIIIHDLSSYRVHHEFSQQDALQLEAGQPASIKLVGLPKTVKGHVDTIQRFASTTPGTEDSKVIAYVLVEEKASELKAGYQAESTIETASAAQAMYVPFDALLRKADGTYFVFVVNGEIAEERNVEIGLETDLEVQITSGLGMEDTYILSPPTDLKAGDLIRAENSGS